MAKKKTKTSPKTTPKTGPNTSNSQAQSKKKQVVKKERGALLTTVLVVIAVQGIFAAYLYYTQNNAVEAQRPWILSAMVLHSLANIAAAIGLFYWKKWGLYVYAASALVAVVAGLLSGVPGALWYQILPVFILGWIIREKRQYFI